MSPVTGDVPAAGDGWAMTDEEVALRLHTEYVATYLPREGVSKELSLSVREGCLNEAREARRLFDRPQVCTVNVDGVLRDYSDQFSNNGNLSYAPNSEVVRNILKRHTRAVDVDALRHVLFTAHLEWHGEDAPQVTLGMCLARAAIEFLGLSTSQPSGDSGLLADHWLDVSAIISEAGRKLTQMSATDLSRLRVLIERSVRPGVALQPCAAQPAEIDAEALAVDLSTIATCYTQLHCTPWSPLSRGYQMCVVDAVKMSLRDRGIPVKGDKNTDLSRAGDAAGQYRTQAGEEPTTLNTARGGSAQNTKGSDGQPAQAHQGLPGSQPSGDRHDERNQGEGGGVRRANHPPSRGDMLGSSMGFHRRDAPTAGLHGSGSGSGEAHDVLGAEQAPRGGVSPREDPARGTGTIPGPSGAPSPPAAAPSTRGASNTAAGGLCRRVIVDVDMLLDIACGPDLSRDRVRAWLRACAIAPDREAVAAAAGLAIDDMAIADDGLTKAQTRRVADAAIREILGGGQ